MSALIRLFRRTKPIVAVVHTGPSPGAPGCLSVECVVNRAVAEARLFVELGVDGLLLQNRHDVPALDEVDMGPEVATFFTRVASEVKRHARSLPVGVQVLSEAPCVAMAVAFAAGCDFVRTTGLTDAFGSRAERSAARLLRYRHEIGARHLPIFADLAPVGPRVDIRTQATGALKHRVDALVLSGERIGEPPSMEDVVEATQAANLPLLIAGGLDADDLGELADYADGFFVGSAFKEGGRWDAPVCEQRVRRLIGCIEYARGQENSSVI
ncbi:hypothetical protein BH23BAC4_BH23BAC4_00330 [soil metagenome]